MGSQDSLFPRTEFFWGVFRQSGVRAAQIKLGGLQPIGEQALSGGEVPPHVNEIAKGLPLGLTTVAASCSSLMHGSGHGLGKGKWVALRLPRTRKLHTVQSSVFRRNFSNGFTLIELMIVVAITAILASIALPSYQESVYRSKMRTAQQDLVGMSLHLENAFNRALAYPSTTNTGAKTKEAIPGWSPSSEEANFVFLITASSATAYTVTAEGAGQMSGCNITLTQANVRATTGCSQGGGSWM